MELLQFTCLLLLISVRCLTGFGQQCGGNQWQCDDGACLPLSWYCDGNGDCMDGSDEMACPCPRGQVACMTGAPGCVSTSAVCDGQRQCSDGSDELNCPENQGCLQGDWRCRNKICIPKDQYCNGANDCVDNSDETCGRCGPMAVRCPGGACLTEDERCDGKLHCSDGSDEPSTCGRTCSEENGGCSHSCLDQPWGALCSCPKGHRLSAHGASCLDVDECSLPYGPCMHFCVNTPGSFYCHCRDGFQLQGTTYCYAKGNYTKLLTAKKGTIGFLNLKTLRFESIQSIGYDPLALAFDLSRSSFYWADDQGNIYKAKEQKSRILYHGQYGVRSLVCDWLTGQLYWTNQKTRSIHVGAADGSGFATVLAKNMDPLELVLLPIESLLFWINKGPGDKMTLERSGMDGLKQESLVVLTAQAPRSLTLDVTVRRLYWMSDFKKSIETVRVDGSGRYSFLEFFKRRPAQSLAVFERWFYWTDQMGLWRSPQDRPDQKTFIQRTRLSVLEAYHEQQQPKAPSACVKSGCQLCMLTLDLPAGFTCTCPDDKLLMAEGSCEYPRFAYATSTTLNLLELKGKELIKTLLLTTDDVMESFDIDWRGDWVYWANSTGDVMRRSLNTDQTETVPTLRPACVVSVDQKMRNLYWLSCDEVYVGVTNMDQGYPRRLYQSGSEVRDVYLDWQRGRLYLLEAGWILSMRLPGGNPRKVLRVEGHVAGRIVLDLKSNTLLWNTEGDELKIMSLLKSQTHLAGREWNVPGSIMAAHSPLLVSLFNDVITVWDRRDRRRVHDVPVGPGVVRVIVALDVKEVPPAQPVCTSPSVMCRGSTLCISQTQLCDTLRDCPDGFDEESCITKCPNRGEFRCKDRRKCIERRLVCDGRAHCQDGSDEIGCQTIAAPTSQTAPLKCRMGSRLCKDGRECVLHSHVCDGEVDCKDGSDEQDCELLCKAGQFQCAHGKKCIDQQQVCDGKAQCQDRSDEMDCFKPTKSCSHRCDNNSRCIPETFLCDRERDCEDGSDEEGCDSNKALPPVLPTLAQTCTSPSVMCRGSTLCISQTQLCDTLRDCPDGFDEESCITKCPNRGEFRCKDRRKCIERRLVCDGRAHCHDGSDEIGCPTMAAPTSQTAPLKCRMGSRLCKDGRECVLHSHVCDGEVDCKDGSDEQNCGGTPIPLTTAYLAPTTTIPVCTSPSVMCRGSTLCISQTQLCDTLRDCPDGFDEESCITKCPNRGEFRCKDRRKCIERRLVCDGRAHCQDGSDEVGCQTIAAPTSQTAPLKCRMGSRLCKDGRECVLHSHVCDGEVDCKDGSDEQDCELLCKAGQFQCAHGKKCIDQQQVCDGKAQCQDRSDEMDCFKPTKSCSHRCDNNSRCIPETFLCDRERDCEDGSDEEGCDSNKALPPVLPTLAQTCTSPSVMCRGSTLCISQTQLCDTLRDCPDGFDEESCITKCPNRGEFRCKDRRKCIERRLVCDGRAHCQDGSDEVGCQTIAAPTSQTVPLKCRMGSRLCKDGRECVLHSHVCDGEVDCKDGSDEQHCELLCKAGQFQCAHGKKCIDQQQVCDGKAQCQDRSDEMDCFKPTKSCSHRCDNNSRCIPETFLCDGERDCVDGSDEEDCVAKPCGQQQYQCINGQCVSEAFRCDGHADCGDHSDEAGCAKPPHCPPERRCPNSHECLVEEWLCDGEQDCQDGSDERNCKVSPVTCGEFQWSCGSRSQCIPSTWRCDGQKDCEDYSDEAGCGQVKCSNQLYQCGSGECVDHSLLCDHIINCPDGSDEGHGCSTNNCSSPGTPQCDQHCVSTPYGPRCICAAGFRLQANGLSCVDVDECNEVLPPVCSHTCLNTRSSFLCRCHHGYLLEPNGRSCKTQDEAHLLASVQYELLVLGLHSSSLSVLSTSQTPVFCVDYDWRDQRVYWVSLEEESIKWTSINTKDTGTLVKGVKSDSIAVDWVGRNLYWLDGQAGQILAVRLGTSTVKSQNYIVVLDEDLEQPRSLLLLPHKGLMYWSEVGSDPQIERSGMDGSERKVVLTRGLSWPVSLSVDTLTDRIYWADEKLQCIGSVSLEGHNVKLLQLTEMPSPFSVMVFNDMVYWSDTKRRTIQVSHKNTGKNRKVLLKRPGRPFGIRMMHPLRQTNVSSPCEKLQCSHICLLAPALSTGPRAGFTGPKAVCRCAAGLLLAGDGLTCSTLVDTTFLLILSPTAVTQIYLSTIHNGVGLKRLPEHHIWSLPGMHQASGLDFAVRERKLYLADAAQGSVDLLKLSSSGLTPGSRVLNLQDDTVMALAVDWVTLNLYWSSRQQPDLHVTTTKGQHTAPLLQLGLQGTTSIALHPPSGRLCFTALDQVNVRSLPQVYCAFMDGRSQKLLWGKAVMPTSLLFSNKGTQLYWADIGVGVIDSILLDGSGYKQFKADPGLMSFTLAENVLLWSSLDKDVTRLWFSDGFQPKQLWFEVNTNVVALRVYSKTSQKGTNSCSARNGGCSQLCLAYPGGRSCRCGRGYQPIDTKRCSPFPSLQCPEGSRACSDGSRCLPLSKFCNHQTDCLDHSDEIKCGSGVKPQDVSNSKPSRGHAGNTVPPGQDWSGSTTPGGVEVLDSELCDVQQCNGHGKCVTRGEETTCQCVLGYQGVFCEEGEGPGVSNAPLTLGILSLIAAVLIAAVIVRKSRARAAAGGQSTEKETLMTDMDEGTVYAVSFNNDLYDPDQELNSSADGTSQHL
ncbi:low-density lipoprotein receptor-related protein 2-like [Salvelinus fontinalis]|uniref:low-density lipoprotein receptor-related protein 2-like n=1 Tax=Salvelinus fontinalis TaxID=8038 RepID=UPI002484EC6D|nr:low-density lipoprotein receptor-related protein 2-like [Salvelinus fontinalis]